MKHAKRLIILPHDVSAITGKGIRHSQRLLRTIRDAYGKAPHQVVSVREFAEYVGLDVEEVKQVMR